jgi:ATP-binding cassette, subfamily B, bacterial
LINDEFNMTEIATKNIFGTPLRRVLQVLKMERREISSIYFYAILNGLIQLSLPLGIQSIISFVLGGSLSTSLIVLIVLVVAGVFFNGLVQVNQMRIIEKVQQKLFVKYSFEYANRIPRIDLKSIDSYYLPELVNRFLDTVSLQKGISKLLLEIPTASIQILFGLILLSFYHPIFIVFSFLLVLLIILILRYTSAKGLQTSIVESDFKYQVVGWLEEMARVVRSFKFSKGFSLNLKKTDKLVMGYLGARTSHFRILQFQYWALIGFKVLITAGMLIVGSVLLVDTQLNVGQFIAAEIVILLVINSVEKIIINLDSVYDVLTSVEKLGKITDKPMDQEGDFELQRKPVGISIEATHLNFSYNNDNAILTDISFSFAPGEKVCIMGEAGSGKSSLLRVLSGAFRHFEGGLLVDGLPVRNYQLESLRSQTGIMLGLQDIFAGTIMENISMGYDHISPQEVLTLADKIGLKNFLEELPDGFNTLLDPIGKRLSKNVIQRILLLRALVNEPRLLLLEEPWQGWETSNRASIQYYLLNENKAVTVCIVTNDEAFAKQCDTVLYLREGQLVAQGKWEDIKNKLV